VVNESLERGYEEASVRLPEGKLQLFDGRNLASIGGGETPNVDEKFEKRGLEPLHFWVVHQVIIDPKPSWH
jgi:hypothetical protein